MYQKLKKYSLFLIGSELFKNTAILISGTVIAQFIPILLQPVLRRLFPPEAFGAYSVYLSIIGILIMVASLRYDLAIVLPKKDKESVNVVGLTMLANLLVGIILFICALWGHKSIQDFLNIPDRYSAGIYLIPVGVLFMSVNQNLNYYLVRKKAFVSSSINKFVRRGTEGSSQIVFGFAGGIDGLFFSDIIGHISNFISVLYQSIKVGFSFKVLSWVKIRYVVKRYVDYPKYNLIPGLMSASSFLLPAIIINRNFSAEFTGYFDLSKLLLSIPLALVSASLASVLLQRFSERFSNRESILNDIKPVAFMVFVVAFLEVVVVLLFGVTLFDVIFGKSWALSGSISKILVWSYAFNFMLISFTNIFVALRKIRVFSIWQIFYFFAITSLFLFKGMNFTDFLTVYVIIEVICYIILLLLIIRTIYSYEKGLRSIDKSFTR